MIKKTLTEGQQISHSLVYLLPAGISSFIPFITIPVFTRVFSPEDYGFLALSIIYAVFMCGFVNFGLSLVFERNFYKYKNNNSELAQLFYSSLLFTFIIFFVLAGITYLLKSEISGLLTGSTNYGLLIFTAFAAHFFYSTIPNYYFIYFKNMENAKDYTLYRLSTSIINLLISLFLVAYVKVGIIGIILAQLITGMILTIFFISSLLRKLPFSICRKILLESLKISYPLTPRIFVGVLNTQLDKYMIGLLATIGGVGVYHIGKKVSELVFTFMTAIENVFNPQVYQRMFGQHESGSDSIGQYLTPFFYTSIFVALCLSLFSEELLTILTPINYHSAIPVVIILSMYFGFLFFGKITSLQLIYSKKTHIISVLSFLRVALYVGINIPLILHFGILGAAWATLLVGVISGIISISVAQKYYRVHYEWSKIFWIIGTFFGTALVLVVLIVIEAPYFWSLSIKSLSLTIFITLGVRYKILSNENLHFVLSTIRNKKLTTT